MSLDEPQLLVGLTADLGEHIRRVGIAEPCGLIDRLSRGLAKCRQSRRQCVDMFPFREDLARVAGQCRTLGYGVNPTLGGAAKSRSPFGEQIGKFFGSLGHFVEELVEGDKVRPLDIPMGLLGLPFEAMANARVRLSNPTDWLRID